MTSPASRDDKDLVILAGKIQTPPLSMEARRETGWLLRRLQQGDRLSMPESRPMPTVGHGCHELRIGDLETKREWRVIYGVTEDAIVILELFAKTTPRTPVAVIARSKARLAKFKKDLLP